MKKNSTKTCKTKGNPNTPFQFLAVYSFTVYFCAVGRFRLNFIFYSLLMAFSAYGQKNPSADCPLELTLKVQARLDSMAAANFDANRIQGYRILLYSGNDRNQANLAKENAYLHFPKGDVYLTYQSPTFKVRFGNFYTRLEAWQILLKLRPDFPNAVITNEVVFVKP